MKDLKAITIIFVIAVIAIILICVAINSNNRSSLNGFVPRDVVLYYGNKATITNIYYNNTFKLKYVDRNGVVHVALAESWELHELR